MSYASISALSSKQELKERVPEFVGSNWIPWSSTMCAYLKSQGVSRYISADYEFPPAWTAVLQTEYNAEGTTAERRKELHEICKDFEDAEDNDNIACGIIQLRVSSSLHHLFQEDDTAHQLWECLQSSFNQPGAAGLFVDFQQTLRWKLDERVDPTLQIARLSASFEALNAHGLPIAELIKGMILLNALPKSWEHIATTLLATIPVTASTGPDGVVSLGLTIAGIAPKLVQEWRRRHTIPTTAHMADANMSRTDMRQGQPSTQWQTQTSCGCGRGRGVPRGQARSRGTARGAAPQQQRQQQQGPAPPLPVNQQQWAGQMSGQTRGPNWQHNQQCRKEAQANKRAARAADANVAQYGDIEYYPDEPYPMAAPVFMEEHFPYLLPSQQRSTPGPSRLLTPGPEERRSGLHPYFRTGMGRIPKLTKKDLGKMNRSASLLSRMGPSPLAARIDAIPEEEDVVMTTFEDHEILSSRKFAKSRVVEDDEVSLGEEGDDAFYDVDTFEYVYAPEGYVADQLFKERTKLSTVQRMIKELRLLSLDTCSRVVNHDVEMINNAFFTPDMPDIPKFSAMKINTGNLNNRSIIEKASQCSN